jgi:ketosteroid isomerase-like protein
MRNARHTAQAMSDEIIERLSSIYEAISRGDWDTPRDALPDDFELRPAPDNPLAGVYRGPNEVLDFFQEFWAAFAEVRVVPEKFVDLDDRVVVFLLMHLTPADSDAKLEMKIAHLWTVEDGEIVRCEVFRERAEALEAAGASERDVR